ncbi:MAG TPA: ECF-type sigma factor [Kofleriaceae bacterium]|nr:ECF-type sigma factor [Kofleriaceae bacterium]
MGEPAAEITALLGRVRDGEAGAREALLPLVYGELENIARGYAHPAMSIEPRGLVHELYLKLVGSPIESSGSAGARSDAKRRGGVIDARDRKHFFAIAALAMRQILADRARRRRAEKRGGDAVQVTLTGLAESGDDVCDALAVHDALVKLEELSERQARIVEMRCLVGLTAIETAEALDISERTVHAEWRLARAWLARELGGT